MMLSQVLGYHFHGNEISRLNRRKCIKQDLRGLALAPLESYLAENGNFFPRIKNGEEIPKFWVGISVLEEVPKALMWMGLRFSMSG